jgi:hypothetical protein
VIRVLEVRFDAATKLPRLGDRNGLSLVRAPGGNDAPVEHEILWSMADRLLLVRHVRSGETVFVPIDRVREMSVSPACLPHVLARLGVAPAPAETALSSAEPAPAPPPPPAHDAPAAAPRGRVARAVAEAD